MSMPMILLQLYQCFIFCLFLNKCIVTSIPFEHRLWISRIPHLMSSLERCPALSGCAPLQAGPSHQSFKPQYYIIPSQSVPLCILLINSTMSRFQIDGLNLWSLFVKTHMQTLAGGVEKQAWRTACEGQTVHMGEKKTHKGDSVLLPNSQFMYDRTIEADVCFSKYDR